MLVLVEYSPLHVLTSLFPRSFSLCGTGNGLGQHLLLVLVVDKSHYEQPQGSTLMIQSLLEEAC